MKNEPDLSPGVLAELYQRRWKVEVVFDELKNKLGEKKAWRSSQAARTAEARFVALTDSLLLVYKRLLERRHWIQNDNEDKRREQRLG